MADVLHMLGDFFELVAPFEHMLVWVTGVAALIILFRDPAQRALVFHYRRVSATLKSNGDVQLQVETIDSDDDK